MRTNVAISRRKVLKIAAFGGMAALALPVRDRLRAGEFGGLPQSMQIVQTNHLLMGMLVQFSLVGNDLAWAQSAATDAVAKMERLACLYSRFDGTSELSRLNAQGYLERPSPAFLDLLRLAAQISDASSGAFDVSIKPVLDVYASGMAQSARLSESLADALQLVGHTGIRIGQERIELARSGMALTFDGIAKGAIVDAGVAALREHGFDSVIVEAGGDLTTSGERGQGEPWRIALRPPRSTGVRMPVLALHHGAVATSGDSLHAFAPDLSLHHILDPKRGTSPSELASVTVVAPTCALADALATAVMVCGVQKGVELISAFPGCEALLVDKQMNFTETHAMSAFYV